MEIHDAAQTHGDAKAGVWMQVLDKLKQNTPRLVVLTGRPAYEMGSTSEMYKVNANLPAPGISSVGSCSGTSAFFPLFHL